MPRTRTPAAGRPSRDAERLTLLALARSASGSRVEDLFWERQLEALLGKLLRAGQDAAVETALEHLLMTDPTAYEVTVGMCESLSESTVIEKDGQRYDVLLIVAPVAAWTRYSIPANRIRPDALDALRAQLHGHVLAEGAQLALAPTLLSIDQMPQSFSATQQWLYRLGMQALGKATTQKLAVSTDVEVANMLADTRYLAGAIAVPEGQAMFRWQQARDPIPRRTECTQQWAAQAEPTFAALLPGCGLEVLLPDAWYTGNREADRRVRPLSIRAAVGWLDSAAGLPADQLRAVVAGCGEHQIDEYRIGFTPRNRNEVVYGCVWPLFDREGGGTEVDEAGMPADPLEGIVELLKAEGVTEVRRIPGLLPMEFCDDCGAPYFPDPTGELVHAELPEESDSAPAHFH